VEKREILEKFKMLSFGEPGTGIGAWIHSDCDEVITKRLATIIDNPLTKPQLIQLLAFGKEAPFSDGFFEYYWSTVPSRHPYNITKLAGYSGKKPHHQNTIESIDHLIWGLHRLYTDALLYFGNIRQGYRELRNKTLPELVQFFEARRFDTQQLISRGPALKLNFIQKDSRYLISEMACKTYEGKLDGDEQIRERLVTNFKAMKAMGSGPFPLKKLLEGDFSKSKTAAPMLFSIEEVWDKPVTSEEDILKLIEPISAKFESSRKLAIQNTNYFLSMVNDLDVYVATSMRNRDDFRNVADLCETVFNSQFLKRFCLRYFDPTVSAAAGHEDKGLIECLMVKCAKVLIYLAGKKESWGKDAEAAMALSLGKPVIFLCEEEDKQALFRDIHPLTRLIEFKTGTAVGAIIASTPEDVIGLLERLFSNTMEYYLVQEKPGYIKLKEKYTNSVVRLQTNDTFLTEAFWNHYHGPS
jgi:hypothetical protein